MGQIPPPSETQPPPPNSNLLLITHFPQNPAVRFWIDPISRHPLIFCFIALTSIFLYFQACDFLFPGKSGTERCHSQTQTLMRSSMLLLAAGHVYAYMLRKKLRRINV
ncbi:hypothetical protein BJX99DRAFT_226375 [Aspergillus californicus]